MRRTQAERRTRRVLRAVLRLYPASFRDELGDDLVETAVDRWRDAAAGGSVGAGVRFWLREGVRFAVDGALERLGSLPSPRDDLLHAVRQLRRAPKHHAALIATLALGVGAAAAVLTVADAVIFRPLPYEGADRLYLIRSRFGSIQTSSNSMLNLRDLQGSVNTFAWIAGAYDRSPALTGGAGEPERVSVLEVTAEYLAGLGARVAVGRPFGDADFSAGAERVAILSDGLWRRRWGGDPSIIGSSVRLDTVAYTVIGVMAPSFRDPEPIESGAVTAAWIPVRVGDRSYFTHRDQYWFQLIGRMVDDATAAEAHRDLSAAGRRLAAAYPDANRYDGNDLELVPSPLLEVTLADARERVLLVSGAVLLLLLLACANAANLFLARGVTRAGELAVRSALGATRGHLARQLFVEALVTTGIAGVTGGLLAAAGLRWFVALAPAGMPRLHEVALDERAFLIVAASTAFAAIAFGTLPALRGARGAAVSAVGARSTATRPARRLQSAFVALEVALSLVLVAGSALLLNSLSRMLRVSPGFDGGTVVVADVRPPPAANDATAQQEFYRALLDRAREEPGIVRAALAHTVPGRAAGAWTRVTPQDGAASADRTRPRAPAIGITPGEEFVRMNPVSADYFSALGIPLLAGRHFEGDPGEGDPLVVVIDEAAARRFFPGDAVPLGRRLALGEPGSDAPFREVIGIVGDVLQRGAAHDREPQVYVPYRQRDIDRLNLVLDVAPSATFDGERIRRLVTETSPGLPVDRVESLSARYAETTAPTRFLAFLLSCFAGIGLLLAAAGTYAITTQALSRRTRELAIRKTLGANAADVWKLALSQTLTSAAIGIAAGVGLTLVLGHVLASQLFGVGPRDPATLVVAAGLIAVFATTAAVAPARRASRVDISAVLRD